ADVGELLALVAVMHMVQHEHVGDRQVGHAGRGHAAHGPAIEGVRGDDQPELELGQLPPVALGQVRGRQDAQRLAAARFGGLGACCHATSPKRARYVDNLSHNFLSSACRARNRAKAAGACEDRHKNEPERTGNEPDRTRTGGNMKLVPVLSAATVLGIASPAAVAQVKWDLPAAYPASNFHTENLMQFAADVDQATGGKLKITVHANASLFKAPEIKRAVQTNQAQIGEILLSNYSNENPLYGVDVLPFVATSYDAARELDRASRPALEKLLAAQGMKLLYTVAWPPQGLYSSKPLEA